MKNPFKTKYRVLEIKKGDDTSKFYPQARVWCWFWKGLPDSIGSSTNAKYKNLELANDFLYDLHKTERKEKIVGLERHEFNELFHKLKDTRKEDDPDPEVDTQRHW